MHWIAPSEKDNDNAALEKRLWAAADQFRAKSGLKSQEYSAPVLGLIFLRFAEVRFAAQRAKLEQGGASSRRGSRVDEPAAYHAEGFLFLPAEARFDYLLKLPEAENIGAKVNEAMRDIEKHNAQLAGVLPKTYNLFTSTLLKELLKHVSEIPASVNYDAFGRIYEYFLGEFARTEGSKGGEFYTPASIVQLLTEIIEPYHGRILDPLARRSLRWLGCLAQRTAILPMEQWHWRNSAGPTAARRIRALIVPNPGRICMQLRRHSFRPSPARVEVYKNQCHYDR